jgi:hypothetical protein
VVVVAIVVVVPVLLGFPTMFFPVPPLVVLGVAAFPFGVQVPAAVFRLAAVLAIMRDRIVQARFRFFDSMFAVIPVIGTGLRGVDNKQERQGHKA